MNRPRSSAPPTKQAWYRRWYFVTMRALRSVVFLQDSPQRIARGAAAGIFCCSLPIFGQMIVGMILAKVIRGNVIASLPWTWISNPVTTIPIWYGCYRIGVLVLGLENRTFAEIKLIFTRFNEMPWKEALSNGFQDLGGIFLPTLLGSVIIGIVAAAIGYACIHWLTVRWQNRREAKRARWQQTHGADAR